MGFFAIFKDLPAECRAKWGDPATLMYFMLTFVSCFHPSHASALACD